MSETTEEINLLSEEVLTELIGVVKQRGDESELPFLGGTVTRYVAHDVLLLVDSKEDFYALRFEMEGTPYMVDKQRRISFQELDEDGVEVTQWMADDLGGEIVEGFLGWRAKLIASQR